jgi:hypothetical protein
MNVVLRSGVAISFQLKVNHPNTFLVEDQVYCMYNINDQWQRGIT